MLDKECKFKGCRSLHLSGFCPSVQGRAPKRMQSRVRNRRRRRQGQGSPPRIWKIPARVIILVRSTPHSIGRDSRLAMQWAVGVPVLGCRELFCGAAGGRRTGNAMEETKKIENCDTANAVDAGGPKGKDEAIVDWTEFKGFADVGLTRFSAA